MKKLALFLAIVSLVPMLFACDDNSNTSSAATSDTSSEAINSEVSEDVSNEVSAEESIVVENPIDELEPSPMTIQKNDDRTYTITSDVFGGTYKRTFYKRDWGTWNIGGMFFTPEGGSQITFVTASTDWEYVYRAGKTASTIDFCGGNHGSEKMLETHFYNGETGDELNLDDKQPVELNLLKIVETTQIYYFESDEDIFANVTRTYYYNGTEEICECDYEIVQDTYFTLSYPTMFPISKDYGTRIVYNLENGKTREWTSSEVGKADYSGPMDKGNAAMSVTIFGHKDPRYQFNVAIYDKEDMTDNFKNAEKTFYWDMNVGQNKLYFSRFSSSTPELVKTGTTWHTLASWEFNYVGDAVYEESGTN
ncbi:MAG: hypothetical protein A2Y17_08025 [Clostridiales bacterium GWF2_38_85]|nr:MAG: hypothetical protein A2Y17_08025 [Clostridiales bacterium GWF2_38_85]HBL83861.1 hypothetical protein [Clostridiales bacterium]